MDAKKSTRKPRNVMSSKRKERITKKLHKIGADWFRGNDDKFIDPNDPVEEQLQNRESYHIHPDTNNPILENLVRLHTLTEIEEYIKARQKVATTADPVEASRIMTKFWDSTSR